MSPALSQACNCDGIRGSVPVCARARRGAAFRVCTRIRGQRSRVCTRTGGQRSSVCTRIGGQRSRLCTRIRGQCPRVCSCIEGQRSRVCTHIRRQRSHIHKPSLKGCASGRRQGTTVTFLLSWFAYFRVFLTRTGFLKEGEAVFRSTPCVIIVTVTVSPHSGAVSFCFTKSAPALQGGTPAHDRRRNEAQREGYWLAGRGLSEGFFHRDVQVDGGASLAQRSDPLLGGTWQAAGSGLWTVSRGLWGAGRHPRCARQTHRLQLEQPLPESR